MAPLRPTAQPFQPQSLWSGRGSHTRLLLGDWQGSNRSIIHKMMDQDRAFFDVGRQHTVRTKCLTALTAEPWLQRTGLPRDALGLLTVIQYYQDVCLYRDNQAEQNEQLEQQVEQERAEARAAAELHNSLLRDQREELARLVAKVSEQAQKEASLHQQLTAAEEELVQQQQARGVAQTALVRLLCAVCCSGCLWIVLGGVLSVHSVNLA